jgi:TonB family protein
MVHVCLIVGVSIGLSMRADDERPAPADSASTPAGIVWVATTGDVGGGGGGGGNRSPLPARQLQTVGADSLSLPIATPPPLAPPQAIEPPREARVETIAFTLPAQPMESGQFAALGAVAGALTAPPASLGPGTESGAGTGKGPGRGPGDGRGLGDGKIDGTGGDFYTLKSGGWPPQLVYEVRPKYTPDAMRARLQGEVWVAAIVMPDGTVANAKVLRSLDTTFGLDEQALVAVRQWRFKPGTRAGRPVPVLVSVSVAFAMQ